VAPQLGRIVTGSSRQAWRVMQFSRIEFCNER
jgi:hypothetical protein